MTGVKIPNFYVLEDTSGYVERESHGADAPISLRLHAVRGGVPAVIAETSYRPKAHGRRQNFRTEIALGLLKHARVRSGIVVAGVRIASSPGLLKALQGEKIDAVF